jgi:hypothetical protein
VVDEFGAGSSDGTVDRPIGAKASQVVEGPLVILQNAKKPAAVFPARDPLTPVFDDLDSGRDGLSGEDSEAVNA